jgi:transposase
MGRPSKRTPESEERILDALRDGQTKSAAAAHGGISESTLYAWAADFPEFSEALEKAENTGKYKLISEIRADKSWQAKAWLTERRWPKEFGRREHVEMTGADGGPIDTRDLSAAIPDHERAALAAAIRAHLRGEEEPAGSPAPAGEG